ncbi:MAG TPA: undecaprenyl-diphosphate phosphatase [Roseiflexaceae bacterium]|nr:undecaprenyl-diphosphate phosphatase [Roseiflexaceae bacterium]
MSVQELSSATRAPMLTRGRLIYLIFASAAMAGFVALMYIGYIQPVVLGIVQGLAEFLPISSAAHLILMRWFFGWRSGMSSGLTFDLALHLGTLVALLCYFWRDWIEILGSAPGAANWGWRRLRGDRLFEPALGARVLASMLVATIPGLIFGVLLAPYVRDGLFRSPRLLAFTLTLGGLMLHMSDTKRPEKLELSEITMRQSLLIGLAQSFALVPGISRLAATLTMSRLLTFDRSTATRYSFLLSAPITLAALAYNYDLLLNIPSDEFMVFGVGVLVSAIVGLLTIHALLDFVGRFSFSAFAVYRAVLAIAIVITYFMRNF